MCRFFKLSTQKYLVFAKRSPPQAVTSYSIPDFDHGRKMNYLKLLKMQRTSSEVIKSTVLLGPWLQKRKNLLYPGIEFTFHRVQKILSLVRIQVILKPNPQNSQIYLSCTIDLLQRRCQDARFLRFFFAFWDKDQRFRHFFNFVSNQEKV